MARLQQQCRLPDGRVLCFDEYGPPDGTPVFYFHGAPSTRLEWLMFGSEALAHKLNARVLVPDRPGLGRSDFQPNRRVGDWPADLAALADQLRLDRFAILAYSGGGPYAVVCALRIPQRLTRVGIVSGAAPFLEPGLADGVSRDSLRFIRLAYRRPRLARVMLFGMGLMARCAPRQLAQGAAQSMPPPDRAILAQRAVADRFVLTIRDALRAGTRGAQWETALMSAPWDFRPQDVGSPIDLWHGGADANAPVAMGRYMAKALPRGEFHYFPGEGHISLISKHLEEFLGAVLAPPAPA